MISKIYKQDNDDEYLKMRKEAYDTFPEDYFKQLQYIAEKGNNKFYVMRLLEIVQYLYSLHDNRIKDYTFNAFAIDCLYRGFLDSIRHMQKDLPDSIYESIKNNIQDFIEQSIKQLNIKNIDEELKTTSERECPYCDSINIEDMGCAFEEGTESSKGPTKILYTCKDCGKKFLLLK
ncbi:hypothetical protein [Thermoanaerobacterium sp. R66]|uniref:hypothetical protein n=1 Tax=Thermoanaerobacterium TaxID=28895 RepID=UPI002380BCEC|nr:hypothetical protein [Thermoanaerobacterium sp. R66]MDE4542272.1 hypothetical protein [Thermoanaerobacterium sp. R66]